MINPKGFTSLERYKYPLSDGKNMLFFSSSCEWSGFRGRPRTDILHNMRLRRRFIAIQIHKHIYIIQHTTPKVLAFDHYIQAVTMAYMGLVMVVVVMVMMVTMEYMTTLSK